MSLLTLFIPTRIIIGYKLAQSPCCYFEMNGTETTCNLTVNALPSSMVGDESVLKLQLVPARCNFVSNMSQLLVLVRHIAGAGEWVACMHMIDCLKPIVRT